MPVSQVELARRLRAAREGAGITQDQLSAAINVPRPSVIQIEAGRRTVSGIELDRLAAFYGKDVREFLEAHDEQDVIAHFRADASLIDTPQTAAALRRCLRLGRDLAALEQLTGIDRASQVAVQYPGLAANSIHSAVSQGTRTADAERRRLALGDAPIEDLIELLEANGVRTAILDLPDEVSGLTLLDRDAAPLVVANRSHSVLRNKFSFAHEYAHVLLDRGSRGLVSRAGNNSNLLEVRANSFAGTFLMPDASLRRQLAELGKGVAGRLPTEAVEGEDAEPADARGAEPPLIRLHDIALLAHHFKVTRLAMINRLRTLRILSLRQFVDLRDNDAGSGRAMARLLALPEPDHADERDRFKRRFAGLALEAYGRGKIQLAKLIEHLTDGAGVEIGQIEELVRAATDRAGPVGDP